MKRAAWLGTFLVLQLSGLTVAATLSEDDPIRTKLADVDARLARLERVVANQNLLQLSNQMEALRADLRAMHNDVDELGHNLDLARRQQKDFYTDLDARLKALETHGSNGAATAAVGGGAGAALAGATPAVPGTSSASAGAGAPSSTGSGSSNAGPGSVAAASEPSDRAAYQAAFALLKNGQYGDAIAAFQKFNNDNPRSSLADNGHYWLGEAYYVNKSYAESQAAFQSVIDKYPQSPKVPDALLKVGYCAYETKQWQVARDALSQVTAKYPDAPAARLAQQRLDKMTAEVH